VVGGLEAAVLELRVWSMNVSEFFEQLEAENRLKSGTHFIRQGVTNEELEHWRENHPHIQLLPEHVELLRRSNGVGVMREFMYGEWIHSGALQFLPLNECTDRDNPSYRWESTWIPIGKDCDGTFYVAYDQVSGRIIRAQPIVAEDSEPLAENFASLLDWVAREYVHTK